MKIPAVGKYKIVLDVDMKNNGTFIGTLHHPKSLTTDQAQAFFMWWCMKSQQIKIKEREQKENQQYQKMSLWGKIKYFFHDFQW